MLAPFAPAEGVADTAPLRPRRATSASASAARVAHAARADRGGVRRPTCYVQVDLVGAAPRTARRRRRSTEAAEAARVREREPSTSTVPPRAADARGSVHAARAATAPGGKTDAGPRGEGRGRQAGRGRRSAVVVVDEAVLALTGYRLPDPLAAFYAKREPGVADHHLPRARALGATGDLRQEPLAEWRDSVRRCRSAVGERTRARSAMAMMAIGGQPRGSCRGAPAQAIRVRTDFAALALFAPASHRCAGPRSRDSEAARQPHALPGDGGGGRRSRTASAKGESTLTARLPLMVRPSAPRFLNFGDRFELPVVVQNQTDAALDVDVAVRASNADRREGAGRRLTVPAQRPRRGPLSPSTTIGAGTARFQVAGVSGRLCRRGRGRAARLDARRPPRRSRRTARSTRGRRRRRAGTPADCSTAGCGAAVRRPRDHDLVHRAAGAHRRGAVPRRRTRSSAPSSLRRASSRSPRCKRRARRLPGEGPAAARSADWPRWSAT